MKTILIDVIRLFLVMLFVYTATNKLMSLDLFVSNLERFPYLKNYARLIAVGIPILEVIASALLIIPKTITYGIWCSFILMLGITGYLFLVIILKYDLPCACAGVISTMTWHQHLGFNAIILGCILWILYDMKYNKDTRTGHAA